MLRASVYRTLISLVALAATAAAQAAAAPSSPPAPGSASSPGLAPPSPPPPSSPPPDSSTSSSSSSSLQCWNLTIPVSVTGQNVNLPTTLTFANLTPQFIQTEFSTYGFANVSGTYNIAARYCQPIKVVPSRQNTLQLLIHGITYTRNYWSGLLPPGTTSLQNQYSWILYAANQGYPTLSIDRLCNGLSDHPNSITVCQNPFHAETIHSIITQARAGQIPTVSKAFKKIVVVGHSLGSLISSILANTHPTDPDALLLTGFTYDVVQGLGGLNLAEPVPADTYYPKVYGNLDPGYLILTNETATTKYLYYGDYEDYVAEFDFATRGTVALGELASFPLGQQPVPNYQGPLYVLNGNDDAAWCQTDPARALQDLPGNCDQGGYSQQVHTEIPNASPFGYQNTPSTGHCLNTHDTAQQSFAAAHNFLSQAGF